MDPIERFGQRLHEAFAKGMKSKRLAHVGGNFTIVVFEKAAWTVITKGAKPEIREEVTDEHMDFVMIMTNDVFEQMYLMTEGDVPELDVDGILAANKVAMHGDMDIFLRYLALNAPDNLLSFRAGGAADVPTRSAAAKKRRTV